MLCSPAFRHVGLIGLNGCRVSGSGIEKDRKKYPVIGLGFRAEQASQLVEYGPQNLILVIKAPILEPSAGLVKALNPKP